VERICVRCVVPKTINHTLRLMFVSIHWYLGINLSSSHNIPASLSKYCSGSATLLHHFHLTEDFCQKPHAYSLPTGRQHAEPRTSVVRPVEVFSSHTTAHAPRSIKQTSPPCCCAPRDFTWCPYRNPSSRIRRSANWRAHYVHDVGDDYDTGAACSQRLLARAQWTQWQRSPRSQHERQ
jgi:hypothetical protein